MLLNVDLKADWIYTALGWLLVFEISSQASICGYTQYLWTWSCSLNYNKQDRTEIVSPILVKIKPVHCQYVSWNSKWNTTEVQLQLYHHWLSQVLYVIWHYTLGTNIYSAFICIFVEVIRNHKKKWIKSPTNSSLISRHTSKLTKQPNILTISASLKVSV